MPRCDNPAHGWLIQPHPVRVHSTRALNLHITNQPQQRRPSRTIGIPRPITALGAILVHVHAAACPWQISNQTDPFPMVPSNGCPPWPVPPIDLMQKVEICSRYIITAAHIQCQIPKIQLHAAFASRHVSSPGVEATSSGSFMLTIQRQHHAGGD